MDNWQEYYRYKVLLLQSFGFVLSTPFCMMILKLMLQELKLNRYTPLLLTLATSMLVLGIRIIYHALKIMEDSYARNIERP